VAGIAAAVLPPVLAHSLQPPPPAQRLLLLLPSPARGQAPTAAASGPGSWCGQLPAPAVPCCSLSKQPRQTALRFLVAVKWFTTATLHPPLSQRSNAPTSSLQNGCLRPAKCPKPHVCCLLLWRCVRRCQWASPGQAAAQQQAASRQQLAAQRRWWAATLAGWATSPRQASLR
jgi:hypothetical protein